ncbi:ArnT family glycosyltransferase [Humitalea sp. 24SJ18S-53]|uniref:ArnT family glycosyltransferase n=1 Tax=Humitalea sp. 24SJ18S-53 TaxID=3422307 RepID=UPI003D665440
MPPALSIFLDRLPETRRPRLVLVLLCLALWLPGFFTIPASDRDEARFAQASRQMVESGDWVRIRVGDEDRNKKPVGIHWAQASVVTALEAVGLGTRADIWAYRIPGVLGALAAVLATFHWGRALVGRRAAFLGAALLASTMVLVVETHIAKTDAALLGTVAAAMGLFGRAYLSPGTFRTGQAVGFWLILGVSILLKGPIGPMVALFAGVTLAIVDRRAGGGWLHAPWLRALRPGWGIPLMLAVAAPWFIAIGIATEGRFFAQAIGEDMLNKVGSGEEAHWGPPGFYVMTFGIAAFPAAFLVLLALPAAWADRLRPGTRFLLAWAAPTWLLFEAVATKLPHYTMPVWPALMLLAGAWAMDPLRRPAPRWVAWIAALALVGTAIGLAVAGPALIWFADGRLIWTAAMAVAGLAAAALLVWASTGAWRAGAYGRAGLAAVLLVVPLYWVVLAGVLPRLEAPWLAPRVATVMQRVAPGLPSEKFGVVGHHEPSLIFAMGSGTRLLRDGAAAAEFLGGAPGRVVAVNDRQETAFRAEAVRLGLEVTVLGEVSGLNYVRGRWLTLMLYRRAG